MAQEQSYTTMQLLDLQFAERKAEFQAVLPTNCSFEKFARIVKTAAIQTPELLAADRASLFMSCFKTAQDGLLPDGREAALVIYNTKQKDGSYKKLVQYMPMVSGVLKKVRNSGELASISAHVVYDKDEFDYCLGDYEHITHKPTVGERGNPICAYAIVKTKDNAVYREVMSVTEIEKIRSISKSKDGQAWKEHWAEMAKKTVIRRISKRLPMSTDLEQVIHRDDELFEFGNRPKPINIAVDTINKQVIDISDAVEVEADAVLQDNEPKTGNTADEVNNDVVVSPVIAAKADKFYKDMNHAKAN